jgi:hypothetical protein
MATKPDDKPKPAKATGEPIVYKFTPINPGDFLRNVPQRDLTAADLAALSPIELHDATAPGPTGKAMYTAVDAPKEAEKAGGDA